MVWKKTSGFFRIVRNYLARKMAVLLVAFMLGMSNVILEEDRMVNDTRAVLEQQEETPEDDFSDTVFYDDVR